MGGVHFSEVPLHAEEDVAAHYEPVAGFVVVVGDSMGQTAGLVEDVFDLDAEVESSDVLGDLGVPLEFRLVVAFRIS